MTRSWVQDQTESSRLDADTAAHLGRQDGRGGSVGKGGRGQCREVREGGQCREGGGEGSVEKWGREGGVGKGARGQCREVGEAGQCREGGRGQCR